jgi:tetratricopeptide (TPR) repeat protein
MQDKGGAKSVAQELEKIGEELEAAVFDMGKLMEKKEFQAVIDRGWKFAKDWYIVERSPISAMFWKYMGLAYINVKDFDGASKCFDNAAMLSPYDTDVLVGKSMVYLAASKVDDAIKALIFALRSDPNNAMAMVLMGLCWGIKGNNERAVAFVRMAADNDKKLTISAFTSLIDSAYNSPSTTDSQRMELTKLKNQLKEVLSIK